MIDIDSLAKVLKDHKMELEEEYGVSETGILGSYVEGKAERNERHRHTCGI